MKFQVKFETEALKGRLVAGGEDLPSKIIFVSGFRPETAATFRGNRPTPGSEWICELVRDTSPNEYRGALLVRPLEQATVRWEETPFGSPLLGAYQYNIKAFFGLRELSSYEADKIQKGLMDEKAEIANRPYRAAVERMKTLLPSLVPADAPIGFTTELEGHPGQVRVFIHHVEGEIHPHRLVGYFAEGVAFPMVFVDLGVATTSLQRSGYPWKVVDLRQAIDYLGVPTVSDGTWSTGRTVSWGNGLNATLSDEVIVAASFPVTLVELCKEEQYLRAVVNCGDLFQTKLSVACLEHVSRYGEGVTRLTWATLMSCPPEIRVAVIARLQEGIRPRAEYVAEARQSVVPFMQDVVSKKLAELLALTTAEHASVCIRRSRYTSEYLSPDERGTRSDTYYTNTVEVVCSNRKFEARSTGGLGNDPEMFGWEEEVRLLILSTIGQIETQMVKLAERCAEASEFDKTSDSDIYAGFDSHAETELSRRVDAEYRAARQALESQVAEAVQAAKARAEELDADLVATRKVAAEKAIRAEAVVLRAQAQTITEHSCFGMVNYELRSSLVRAAKTVVQELPLTNPSYSNYLTVSGYVTATRALVAQFVAEYEGEFRKLEEQTAAGEVLVNFGGTHRWGGSTNQSRQWVIRPDGQERGSDSSPRERSGDGSNLWRLVAPEELAISWTKAYTAADHEFIVDKLPQGGCTKEQLATIERIEREISGRFDDAAGMSGNSSPGIGNGWNLGPKTKRFVQEVQIDTSVLEVKAPMPVVVPTHNVGFVFKCARHYVCEQCQKTTKLGNTEWNVFNNTGSTPLVCDHCRASGYVVKGDVSKSTKTESSTSATSATTPSATALDEFRSRFGRK